jgi:uncharacterized protein
MIDNLLDPTILCFVVGLIAGVVKSDLRLPASSYEFVSMYLLLALGFRGGVQLAQVDGATLFMPLVGTLFISMVTPLIAYFILTRLGSLNRVNAGSIAAHYGSVSAVTLATAMTFLKNRNIEFEPYIVALMVLMEIPAICLGIFLAKGGFNSVGNKRKLFRDILLGKGVFLLVSGLSIGLLAGPAKMQALNPLFDDCFKGFLALFLLELGIITARQFAHLKKAGVFLFSFAVFMPLISGGIGLCVGYYVNLSVGGAMLLAILAASSSYIAAPTALRMAVPEANPVLSLTPSLAVTFPLNITFGIPLFYKLSQLLYGL